MGVCGCSGYISNRVGGLLMGFLVRQTCHESAAALNAVVADMPYFDGAGVKTLQVSSASIDGAGLVTLGIDVTGDTTSTFSRTVQLTSCTASAHVGSTDGLLMVMAFFLVWSLAFIAGLKR